MDTKRNAVFKFLDEIGNGESSSISVETTFSKEEKPKLLKNSNFAFMVTVVVSYAFIYIHIGTSMPIKSFSIMFYSFACISIALAITARLVKSQKLSNLLIASSIYLVGLCIFAFALYFKDKARKEKDLIDLCSESLKKVKEAVQNQIQISVEDLYQHSEILVESSNNSLEFTKKYIQTCFSAIIYWNVSYIVFERFNCLSTSIYLAVGVSLTWTLVSGAKEIVVQIAFPFQFIAVFFAIYGFKFHLHSAMTSLNQKNIQLTRIQNFSYDWLLNLNVSYFILKKGEAVFCNKHYDKTIRKSKEEGKLKVHVSFIAGVQKEDRCEEISAAIEKNELKELTKMAVLTDGTRYFECVARKYASGYVEVFLFDITDSVIKERQKLDEKYKNTVFAKVAHEFKTPITNIAYLAEKIKGKTSDSELKKELKMMKGLSDYVTFLVSDITNYFKSTAKMTILPEVTKLGEVMEFSHNVLCSLLEVKSSVKRSVTPVLRNNCRLTLMIDQVRLKQILLNILSNAAKFTTHGKITLSSQEKEGKVVLTVKDEGIGIPADKLSQLKNSDEVKFEVRDEYNNMGSGLGVSISKQLCKEMGFSFNIDSVEGEGTTVTVSIPKNEVEDHSVLTDKTEIFDGPYLLNTTAASFNSVVIVADDNALIRSSMKGMVEAINRLYSKNWNVIEDGIFALNEVINLNLEGKQVEFLLTDEFMDFLSGSATVLILKKLMNDQKISKFPCFSCSAFEHDNFRENIKDCGADQLLSKPVSKDSLVRVLREEGLI